MQQLMTPKNIADRLNCKLSTIYSWARSGLIPALKINGLVRFDPDTIEHWLLTNNIKPLDIRMKEILQNKFRP